MAKLMRKLQAKENRQLLKLRLAWISKEQRSGESKKIREEPEEQWSSWMDEKKRHLPRSGAILTEVETTSWSSIEMQEQDTSSKSDLLRQIHEDSRSGDEVVGPSCSDDEPDGEDSVVDTPLKPSNPEPHGKADADEQERLRQEFLKTFRGEVGSTASENQSDDDDVKDVSGAIRLQGIKFHTEKIGAPTRDSANVKELGTLPSFEWESPVIASASLSQRESLKVNPFTELSWNEPSRTSVAHLRAEYPSDGGFYGSLGAASLKPVEKEPFGRFAWDEPSAQAVKSSDEGDEFANLLAQYVSQESTTQLSGSRDAQVFQEHMPRSAQHRALEVDVVSEVPAMSMPLDGPKSTSKIEESFFPTVPSEAKIHLQGEDDVVADPSNVKSKEVIDEEEQGQLKRPSVQKNSANSVAPQEPMPSMRHSSEITTVQKDSQVEQRAANTVPVDLFNNVQQPSFDPAPTRRRRVVVQVSLTPSEMLTEGMRLFCAQEFLKGISHFRAALNDLRPQPMTADVEEQTRRCSACLALATAVAKLDRAASLASAQAVASLLHIKTTEEMLATAVRVLIRKMPKRNFFPLKRSLHAMTMRCVDAMRGLLYASHGVLGRFSKRVPHGVNAISAWLCSRVTQNLPVNFVFDRPFSLTALRRCRGAS
jgi:hypothetical protein